MEDPQQLATRVLALLDLTRLEDDADAGDGRVRAMCKRAATAFGHPAAVCVYPRFVQAAHQALTEIGLEDRVAVATVANFPEGFPDAAAAARETGRAIALGADEVDVVFPWRALLAGDADAGHALVRQCRSACGNHTLKVILESGMLGKLDNLRRAAEIAIAEGADFIKTSTGKVETNATPDAARVMLETIHAGDREVGFKVAGGVRTLDDARQYMQLAEDIMGTGWISPAHFRIGASGLLDALLAELEQK